MNLSVTSTSAGNDPSLKPWVLSAHALTVFYGCPELPRLSHYFLPRVLLNENRILYLDGANEISPLLIARFARERGREPSLFNRLIRVSRAFTCFQLTALVERTPKFLQKFPADILIVTAFPDLYFDEDVRDREACASFEHALEGLQKLTEEPIAVAIFTDATSFQTRRQEFFQRLIKQADSVIKIEAQPENKLVFACEKPPLKLPR